MIGQLRDLVAFDQPNATPDAFGGQSPGWTEALTTHARLRTVREGEEILQGRLAGRATLAVRIRRTATTDTINGSWRMRDLRTADVYNVRAATRSADRLWIDLLVEGGAVT